jgi:hypothetical protein
MREGRTSDREVAERTDAEDLAAPDAARGAQKSDASRFEDGDEDFDAFAATSEPVEWAWPVDPAVLAEWNERRGRRRAVRVAALAATVILGALVVATVRDRRALGAEFLDWASFGYWPAKPAATLR